MRQGFMLDILVMMLDVVISFQSWEKNLNLPRTFKKTENKEWLQVYS